MKSKLIIAISVGAIGCILLLNGLVNDIENNKKQDVIEHETTTNVITTTEEKKEPEKAVKTTKKKKKKTTKISNFNIKYNKTDVINYAYSKIVEKWGESEWEPFYNLVAHESGWNPNNVNKSSGACGLMQMHPCSKTNKAYRKSYQAQIQAGIDYISSVYSKPSNAWKKWKERKPHWY